MPQPNPTAVEDAAALLGVAVSATDEELRAAYLEKVRLHPPDREPELFERARDAYDLLRNPTIRARQVLHSPRAIPLAGVLEGTKAGRRFVGPAPWLAVLKETRS
jgi:DnaJ-class molecular chaperone